MKTIQVGGHRKNSKIEWAMVSDDDFELVSQYKWSILKKSNTIYAVSYIDRKCLYLHRFLLGLDFGDKRVVNHKDGNGLNNQRDNIEICSQLYNTQSINQPNSNKGYIYLYKNRITKPWNASIQINKITHRAYFATEEEAKQFISDKIKHTQ
jgi:hypothetical protein